jgi:hypothetical protein
MSFKFLTTEVPVDDEIVKGAARQAAYTTTGAAIGAATNHAVTPRSGSRTSLAIQVGSAMGVAAVGGAGVSGTIAAGTAVVTAKVVDVGTTKSILVATPLRHSVLTL